MISGYDEPRYYLTQKTMECEGQDVQRTVSCLQTHGLLQHSRQLRPAPIARDSHSRLSKPTLSTNSRFGGSRQLRTSSIETMHHQGFNTAY